MLLGLSKDEHAHNGCAVMTEGNICMLWGCYSCQCNLHLCNVVNDQNSCILLLAYVCTGKVNFSLCNFLSLAQQLLQMEVWQLKVHLATCSQDLGQPDIFALQDYLDQFFQLQRNVLSQPVLRDWSDSLCGWVKESPETTSYLCSRRSNTVDQRIKWQKTSSTCFSYYSVFFHLCFQQ